MGQHQDDLKIFAGNSNLALAREICEQLKIPLGDAVVETFSDGESKVEVKENVRGGDVFVVQSTCSPGNTNLMELLLLLDAFKRASAKRITAVVPYYGYARQDRKVAPRVPISAKLVADLITTAGASRVLTMDLHSGQIQGFFNIPVDNLYATPVLLQYVKQRLNHNEVTIISPDAGGVERARDFATRLNASLAIIDKRRSGPNVVAEMNIIGEVKGQTAVLLDDMVDTAGTLTMAAAALKREGAKRILACCTHAVLSGPAIKKIIDSPLEELIATNTVPLGREAAGCEKIKVLSVAHVIAEAIHRTHEERSISSLFD
ncbi:MAG TPA: ribose-phosphate pyrophosphokinase [Verrucomicrobiae bacterium]|jgi:ribose-phosphate pyrophosphokinase|nr:ribose-phosphate pyrophosphokinase [Verrucomicrobiae bacterium]